MKFFLYFFQIVNSNNIIKNDKDLVVHNILPIQLKDIHMKFLSEIKYQYLKLCIIKGVIYVLFLYIYKYNINNKDISYNQIIFLSIMIILFMDLMYYILLRILNFFNITFYYKNIIVMILTTLIYIIMFYIFIIIFFISIGIIFIMLFILFFWILLFVNNKILKDEFKTFIKIVDEYFVYILLINLLNNIINYIFFEFYYKSFKEHQIHMGDSLYLENHIQQELNI